MPDRSPRRIQGPDRYSTAAPVVAEVVTLRGADPEAILIATGNDFADAQAAGAAAAAADGVVLLSNDATSTLPTDEGLARWPDAEVIAIGGPASFAYPQAEALAGAERTATAVAVAERFFTAPPAAGLGRADEFVDALAGAAVMAREGGPVLVISGEALSAPVADYLCEVQPPRLLVRWRQRDRRDRPPSGRPRAGGRVHLMPRSID